MTDEEEIELGEEVTDPEIIEQVLLALAVKYDMRVEYRPEEEKQG